MSNYFLDTNILIDFLGDRKPFGKYALRIFKKRVLGEWILWTSSSAILTTYYVIEKIDGSEVAREKIEQLLSLVEINPITKADLLHAITSSFKDFEDSTQNSCALGIKSVDGIVTRNKKDFKYSQLRVYSPEELFSE